VSHVAANESRAAGDKHFHSFSFTVGFRVGKGLPEFQFRVSVSNCQGLAHRHRSGSDSQEGQLTRQLGHTTRKTKTTTHSETEIESDTALPVQRFGLERNAGLAGGLFLPVLSHPVLPAPTGGHIASRECQGGNIRVGNLDFLRAVFGENAYERFRESRPGSAIKHVSLDLRPIL